MNKGEMAEKRGKDGVKVESIYEENLLISEVVFSISEVEKTTSEVSGAYN